jgi:hypothetical protein
MEGISAAVSLLGGPEHPVKIRSNTIALSDARYMMIP